MSKSNSRARCVLAPTRTNLRLVSNNQFPPQARIGGAGGELQRLGPATIEGGITMCRKVGTMGDKSCLTGVATENTKAGDECEGISVGTPGVPAVDCISKLPIGATTEEDPVTLIEPEDAGIRADPMGTAMATQAVATAEEAAVAWTMGTRTF